MLTAAAIILVIMICLTSPALAGYYKSAAVLPSLDGTYTEILDTNTCTKV